MPGATQSDIQLARAAIIVLSASVGSAPLEIRFRMDSAKAVSMPIDEAVLKLAGIPKPAECAAEFVSAHVIIRCGPLSVEASQLYHQRLMDLTNGTGFIGTIGSQYLVSDSARVLISGNGDSVVLTYDQLRRWYYQYFIAGNVSLTARHTKQRERDQGIELEIVAGRTEDYRGPIPPR